MMAKYVWLLLFACVMDTLGDVYIGQGPKHQRVRAGSRVEFHCTAGSDDLLHGPPTIHWKRDDEKLSVNPRVKLTANTLVISNASTSDTGMYMCTARRGMESDSASAQLIVENVPDPPIQVQLTHCTDRIAQLQWKLISENYSPVIQFIIEYNTSFSPHEWIVARTQLPRNRHYQRIALSPWGNYSFRVIAQNGVGSSRPSLPTERQCHMPPDVPHHNPKGACTRNIQPHTLVISWQRMSREEQNAPGFYYLIKWRNVTDSGKVANFQDRIVAETEDSLTIEKQPIYKPYEIYVLAINTMGEAVMPPQMVIGYSGEDVPLESVHNFRLNENKDVTNTTADFQWDSVNTGPWRMQGFFRGYKIQFWKTNIGITTLKEHSIIYREPGPCWKNMQGHQSHHHDKKRHSRRRREVNTGHVYNLWPYTNITAQIVVLNAKYEGPPSKTITFTTKQGVPGPVQDFKVTLRGSTYLDVTWTPPTVINGILLGYTLGYKLLQSHEPTYQLVDPYWEQIEIDNPRLTEFKFTNLEPKSPYRLSIWARTIVSKGDVYEIEETTLPSGPPAVPQFFAEHLNKQSVNVTLYPAKRGNPGTVFLLYYRRLGQLHWTGRRMDAVKKWLVVEGLIPGVIYEMRVVAKNGEAEDSPESSSPVKTVQIGMKRKLPTPIFEVLYLDMTSFKIRLLGAQTENTVSTFYVQYRPRGHEFWRSTDDQRKEQWVVISDLLQGVTYEIRVVTKGNFGESASQKVEYIAGNDPDPQASVDNSEGPLQYSGSSSTITPSQRIIISCLSLLYTTHMLVFISTTSL